MPISTATLNEILDTLVNTYDLKKDDLVLTLAAKDLLPKKMVTYDDIYASKKAKEFAEANNITPTGTGSAKNGKLTIADLKKLSKTDVEIVNITPAAKKLVDDHDLDISLITGTGDNGRIITKDVNAFLSKPKEKPNITAQAQALADKYGFDTRFITGTGDNGRIKISDVEAFKKMNDSDNDSDDDKPKKPKKPKKKKNKHSDSDNDSDDDN